MGELQQGKPHGYPVIKPTDYLDNERSQLIAYSRRELFRGCGVGGCRGRKKYYQNEHDAHGPPGFRCVRHVAHNQNSFKIGKSSAVSNNEPKLKNRAPYPTTNPSCTSVIRAQPKCHVLLDVDDVVFISDEEHRRILRDGWVEDENYFFQVECASTNCHGWALKLI